MTQNLIRDALTKLDIVPGDYVALLNITYVGNVELTPNEGLLVTEVHNSNGIIYITIANKNGIKCMKRRDEVHKL